MGKQCPSSNLIGQKKITVIATGVFYQNYVMVNGKTYIEDGKHIKKDFSRGEEKVARWLSQKLGTEVKLIPKVDYPHGIKTPDYIIKNEKWDLKRLTSNKNNAIYTAIRDRQKQANNFVIDISKSKLTMKQAELQTKELYKIKTVNWLNKVIIKKNNEFIKITRK